VHPSKGGEQGSPPFFSGKPEVFGVSQASDLR
jgi:hypothetical protein